MVMAPRPVVLSPSRSSACTAMVAPGLCTPNMIDLTSIKAKALWSRHQGILGKPNRGSAKVSGTTSRLNDRHLKADKMKSIVRRALGRAARETHGWGDDALTQFFNMVRSNQQGSYAGQKAACKVLIDLDAAFEKIGTKMTNPQSLVAPFFLYRAHSAFRAACATALAGQAVETFVLLRSCLEFASYGLYVDSDRKLEKIWFDRHENAASRVGSNFKMPKIRAVIKARDGRLEQVFNTLYTRCIDSGAHPNERAVHGSLAIKEEEGRRTLQQIYLHGEGTSWQGAMKATAEVGLCCLFLFQKIPTFTHRFMLLGLREDLQSMRKEVGNMFRQKPRSRPGLLLPRR